MGSHGSSKIVIATTTHIDDVKESYITKANIVFKEIVKLRRPIHWVN